MKKTFVGAVAALLFMFCFSLHPVSAQAAEHMLQMENDEWVCYTAGQRDNSYTGMAVNEYGWWYINKGLLDSEYTGIASNEYGEWYFVDGVIAYDYTDEIEADGHTYVITNGYVTQVKHSTIKPYSSKNLMINFGQTSEILLST